MLTMLRSLVPEPWLLWLTVSLCRQRLRQRWLIQVRDAHLREVSSPIGAVPDLPGWTYTFHGVGLLLSGPDGELLDVDFQDGEFDGETIDPYFFASRLLGLSNPGLPEAQCQAWLGHRELVVRGLRELRSRGLLAHPTSQHIFHLAGPLMEVWEAVGAIDFTNPRVALQWMDGPDDAFERFEGWVIALLTSRPEVASLIAPICDQLPESSAEALCLSVLDGPVDSATGRAVAWLDGRGDDVLPAVSALLDRLDPPTQHPYAASTICAYLLRRNWQVDLVITMAAEFAAVEKVTGYNSNPMADELCMLLLEYAPARAVAPLRHTLRFGSSSSVRELCALLVLIGEPWGRRELSKALSVSTEPMRDAELRAGMRGAVPSWLMHEDETRALAERLKGCLSPYFED